jgi:hypothetical protein
MTTVPDYPGLVKVLQYELRHMPDARKEAMLTTEEAARVRSLGFEAAAGRWKVPPLPPELVRGNQLFENYSEGWDELQDGILRTSQIQKTAGQPSARDREVVDPPAPSLPREIAVGVLRNQELGVERPVPAYREDPDAKLVEELVAKMCERAQKADRPMRRRRLQQLYWRYPGKIFNRAFAIMVRDRRIFLEIR